MTSGHLSGLEELTIATSELAKSSHQTLQQVVLPSVALLHEHHDAIAELRLALVKSNEEADRRLRLAITEAIAPIAREVGEHRDQINAAEGGLNMLKMIGTAMAALVTVVLAFIGFRGV